MLVMCMCAHNLLRPPPPPWKSWIRPYFKFDETKPRWRQWRIWKRDEFIEWRAQCHYHPWFSSSLSNSWCLQKLLPGGCSLQKRNATTPQNNSEITWLHLESCDQTNRHNELGHVCGTSLIRAFPPVRSESYDPMLMRSSRVQLGGIRNHFRGAPLEVENRRTWFLRKRCRCASCVLSQKLTDLLQCLCRWHSCQKLYKQIRYYWLK